MLEAHDEKTDSLSGQEQPVIGLGVSSALDIAATLGRLPSTFGRPCVGCMVARCLES